MYPHKFLSAIIFLLFAFALSACKLSGEVNLPVGESREVTDDLGRAVKIPLKIERAVSLAPNLTENIFAIGAGNRLVGVTTYCNYPKEAEQIAKIGDTINPNLESIIALKPQIVFISTASQIESFSKILEGQNILVFVTNPSSIDGVYQSLFQLGAVLNENENAATLVASLKRRAAEVEIQTTSAEDTTVFVQISREPLFTIGKTSFITDLINRAGGISVTANTADAYPKFSKETALALQPEAIILSDSEDNRAPNEVFKDSPAMKNGRVFKINADLLSRPGPRMFDALEQIARALHPEKFR